MKLSKDSLLAALGGLAGLFAAVMTVRVSGYPKPVLWAFVLLSAALIVSAVFKLRVFKPLLALLAVFSVASNCYLYRMPELMTAIRGPIENAVISQDDYLPSNPSAGEFYVADILKGKTVLINGDSLLKFIPAAFAKEYCCEYGELSSDDANRGFELIRQAMADGLWETGDTVVSVDFFNLLSNAYSAPNTAFGSAERVDTPKSFAMLWTDNLKEADMAVLFSIENGYHFYLMSYEDFCGIFDKMGGGDV